DPAVNDAPVNYVNRNDWCLFAGKICTLDTGLIERSQNVAVTVWHPSGVQVYPKIAAFEDHTSKIQIRWEEWEEGLYQITLSDPVSSYTADHRVFVYKSGARPEGIIRIHAVADAPEYNLLTEDGSLRAGNQLRT